MKLWKSICTFIFALCYLPLAIAAAGAPTGTWTTIDDKTGEKRAVVRLSVSGGELSGTIEKIYPQPGDTGICDKCPGAFKDKKILGLRFVWGLKDQGNGEWGGGSILDPKSGKIYRCKVALEGNKLLVRGYVGLSILGRTQTWIRS